MNVFAKVLTLTGCALFAIAPAAIALPTSSAPSQQQLAKAQEERPRVTVFTLAHSNVSSDDWWWQSYSRGLGAARGVSELLVNELVQDGSYAIMDSSRIETETGGLIDEGTAIARAGELNLDAVVAGTITQFDISDNQRCANFPVFGSGCSNQIKATVQLHVRLIDPRSGMIIATAEGEGKASVRDGNIALSGNRPDVDSVENRAANEILTEATEEAIEQIVSEISAAQERF